VLVRDDLYLEYATMLNLLQRHQEALDHLLARKFHPWEGGEGKVAGQYVVATTELARQALRFERFEEAANLLQQAQEWPDSLGEGKLPGIHQHNIHYFLGLALQGLDRTDEADHSFARAASGNLEPTSAMFYNDQPPEMVYYQGLAHRALNCPTEANNCFQKLIDYGMAHLEEKVAVDFFAVSLPDFQVLDEDLNRRNQIHCRFMVALGSLGLEGFDRATEELEAVLALDRSHLGATILLRDITAPLRVR
ncbi:MAG: DUF5107 domain-containing protein, partial [Bythopirellula sp.]